MGTYDQSELLSILRDPQATSSIEQADAILGRFAVKLHDYCRGEQDLAERYRRLVIARGGIAAPCELAQGEVRQNKLHAYLFDAAVGFIDGELNLVKLAMEFPKAFTHKEKCRAPFAGWDGTQAELIELYISLQELGKILKPSGEPMTFADVIDFLRESYGVDISQPYGRKIEVLTRAKGGAPFLKKMLDVYLKKVEEANM